MPTDGQTAPDLTLRPTEETYQAFQHAYDHFNFTLFEHALPGCLITFQRRPASAGYFVGGRFIRGDNTRCDEIALNPALFRFEPVESTLSTLVHEMVHLWQHHYGRPGRGRYHNRQWAEKMKSIGLQPSDTCKPGGKETGDSMGDYVVEGGAFKQAAAELVAAGFVITWEDAPPDEPTSEDAGDEDDVESDAAQATETAVDGPDRPRRRSRSGKRVKYSCAACGLNAWARHGAMLICGTDQIPMTPVG